MNAYPKALLLVLAVCATEVRADSTTGPSVKRVAVVRTSEVASKAKAVDQSGLVVRTPAVDDQTARLQNEVRQLAYELSRTPKYFDDPENDKLRP